MIGPLATAVIVVALVVAAGTALLALLNRRIGRVVLGAVAVVEVVVLAQLVASVVLLFTGERPAGSSIVEFLGYQVATVLVMPAGVAWAISDRSRWAVGVLTVAALAVAVMTVRMNQLWG